MKKNLLIKGIINYSYKEIIIWNNILKNIKNIVYLYGYKEIKLPIIEKKNLFFDNISNDIDIIKQMFIINNNNKLIFRPEGTLPFIKYIIYNGLFRKQKDKFWYFGPMFRYENPQLLRHREFYQFGVENFGYISIGVDIELLIIIFKIFKSLNLEKYINIEINYLGSSYTLEIYKNYLIEFIKNNIKNNFNIEKYKLFKNPFKIFDIKDYKNKFELKNNILSILNFLRYEELREFYCIIYNLKKINIPFYKNYYLFRGLDYYNKIIFECKTNIFKNNKSISICSGGRYDNLSKKINKKMKIPSSGFAIGFDRLFKLNTFLKKNILKNNEIDIYISYLNKKFLYETISLSEKIRFFFKNKKIFVDYSDSNIYNKINFIKNKKINMSFIIKNFYFKNKIEIIYINNLYKLNFLKNYNDIYKIIKNFYI